MTPREMGQLRDFLVTFICRLLSFPFSIFSPSLPAGRSFSSIVVLKPCCIGDVIMATPALAALRQAYPQAHLAFVVGPWARDAVNHNPRIDEIIDCGNIGNGRKLDWREYLSAARRLRKGHFDLAVVLDRSALLGLIPFLARVPYRAGIDSAGRGFSLTTKAPWRGTRHEAELYMDVIRALGIDPGQAKAEFYVGDADRLKANRLLDDALAAAGGGTPNDKLAMIHPGGAVNPGMVLSAKRWLPDRYAAIARRLIQDGWTVLLVGSGSDRPAADMVLGSLGDGGSQPATRVVDLVDKLSLGEFAAVVERCHLFLGNDSGPTHVAAAVGTPTVAVFGPSTPEMYAPFGPRVAVVYNQVNCSPCFVNGRFASDCRDHKCMQAVEVEDVWQTIKLMLGDLRHQ